MNGTQWNELSERTVVERWLGAEHLVNVSTGTGIKSEPSAGEINRENQHAGRLPLPTHGLFLPSELTGWRSNHKGGVTLLQSLPNVSQFILFSLTNQS